MTQPPTDPTQPQPTQPVPTEPTAPGVPTAPTTPGMPAAPVGAPASEPGGIPAPGSTEPTTAPVPPWQRPAQQSKPETQPETDRESTTTDDPATTTPAGQASAQGAGPAAPSAATASVPETGTAARADAGPQVPPVPRSAWRRLLVGGRPRLTRGNIAATALTLALGFALATQVQSTSRQGLDTLRTPDLVRILGDQNARAARLDADVRQLEKTKAELEAGSGGKEAVQRAQAQLDALGILTGTQKATGPGVTITINQPGDVTTYANMLDLVEELRDAGAEAIQVGGARIVASTAFTQRDGAMYAGETKLTPPYVVKAVGDAATLQSALKIPGGIGETLEQAGATVTVTTSSQSGKPVVVDALAPLETPRYARPVPAPSASAT